MAYATTTLTPEEQSKVPTPNYVPLTWDELVLALSLPSTERPRIYGFIEPDKQIVKLTSMYYVEQYEGMLAFAWMSNTTIADLIQRAKG